MSALKKGGFVTRLATALVALPLTLALIWVPALSVGFTLFVVLIASVGLWEYYGMARKKGVAVDGPGGLAAGGALVLVAGFAPQHMAAALYGAILLMSAIQVLGAQVSIAALVTTVFGVVYVSWFSAHAVLMHQLPGIGPGLVTLMLVAVVLTDVAAYFVGKSVGRHKMAPIVSPNKTWEGAFGGFAFAVLGMAALYALRSEHWLHDLPAWSLTRYLVTGALLSIAAQVGDLTESILKRDSGVKDSGTFFPGHGGVLDRCDGFLFAAPVLYYSAVF